MAGSTPIRRYRGTITLPSHWASTGAMQIIPTMDKAMEPSSINPVSNLSPKPHLLPRRRSKPPSTAPAAMTIISTSFIGPLF